MINSTALFLSGVIGFCFFVGILIGICGVGGILIIPFLVYIVGIEIHTVIPACMAGFSFSAIFAVYSYARRGSIRWDKAIYLAIGAAPGAYLGSITVLALSSFVLEFIVVILVFVSGVRSLKQASAVKSGTGLDSVPNLALIALGLFVGYGSSVSGTGGPLLLVPSLLLLNYPVMAAVGLSMAIQIPITPFATLGHVLHGSVDWVLAVPIGIGVASGVLIGAVIAHRISAVTMQRVVAIALLFSGAMIVSRFIV